MNMPWRVGEMESDAQDSYYADWLPILDADGVEVCRVGYTFWRHRIAHPREWKDGEREAVAAEIVSRMNAPTAT